MLSFKQKQKSYTKVIAIRFTIPEADELERVCALYPDVHRSEVIRAMLRKCIADIDAERAKKSPSKAAAPKKRTRAAA